MTRSLEGRVAIVTGASRGIGRAIAVRLAQEGASLVLAALHDGEGLEETAGACRLRSVRCATILGDVADETHVESIVRLALQTFERLDVLVNNAAVAQPPSAADRMEVGDWDRTLDVDVRSVFLGAKFAIPAMRVGGGGSIVNVSSVNSWIHAPGLPAYSAAKGAVDALTRQLAVEYGHERIRVNSINPGLILVDQVRAQFAAEPEEATMTAEVYPLGRAGTADEVAAVAAFLASDASSFVTGASIPVDGGLSIVSAAAVLSPRLRRGWRPGTFRFKPPS